LLAAPFELQGRPRDQPITSIDGSIFFAKHLFVAAMVAIVLAGSKTSIGEQLGTKREVEWATFSSG
jgi:hypothetical protein